MNPSSSLSPAQDLDANADSPHPLLLTRLTLKSSTSTFADANHSPYNDDLLTPPLTNPSLDEPPFRPAESDRTSLSMKRRHVSSHRRRRRHNRACASSGDVDEAALVKNASPGNAHALSRSQSAPTLTILFPAAFRRNKTLEKASLHLLKKSTDKAGFDSRRGSLPKHSRRWTMPGKAAPTRVLTSMFPSAELGEPSVHDKGGATGRAATVDTPAMITLQRAASGGSRKTSLRPEAYTSFPTPTFTKTRSGFVTTFFGDGWQRPDNTLISASIKSVSIASQNHSSGSGSGRASVDHGSVRPSHSTTADPVCTGVVLDPVIQSQISECQPTFRARRCSTKYVSGASAYEVIWDENVSNSSSSRRTSAEQATRINTRFNDTIPERRQSVAMDKLETQLSKGLQQSRKSSLASKGHDSARHVAPRCRSTSRKDFHNMLNFQLPGFGTEEEAESLPRSRASTFSKRKLTGLDMEVHLTTVTGDEAPMRHADFFPPLSSSRTGSDTSKDPLLINPWRTSWETERPAVARAAPKKVDDWMSSSQRQGSTIGQSTGVRKKSVQSQRARRVRNAGITRRKRSVSLEDDRKPLLGQINNWPDTTFSESYDH